MFTCTMGEHTHENHKENGLVTGLFRMGLVLPKKNNIAL